MNHLKLNEEKLMAGTILAVLLAIIVGVATLLFTGGNNSTDGEVGPTSSCGEVRVIASRRRGKKDGTNTDSPGDAVRSQSGGSPYGGDLSTSQSEFPERPDTPRYEFNGRNYFGYGDSSPRVYLPLAVIMPRAFDLQGWLSTTGKSGASVATPKEESPGLDAVDTLWKQAYRQLIFLGEARDEYRHLPATLNDEYAVKSYITQYMLILAKLVGLIAMQKMTTYDRVSRTIGLAGATGITRSRLDQALRTLTSIPMFPVFHKLAIYWATPVTGGPTTPVVFKTFPWNPVSYFQYAGMGTMHNLVEGVFSDAETAMDRFGNVGNSLWWTHEMADIRRLMQPLLGDFGAGSVADKQAADVLNLQALLRMENVQPNPMTYKDVKPAMSSDELVEQLLHYGVYSGKKEVSGGTDKIVVAPGYNWNNSMVELRTPGQPTMADMLGFNVPICASGQFRDVDETINGGWILGPIGEVMEVGSTAPSKEEWKNLFVGMVRRTYDEQYGARDVWSVQPSSLTQQAFSIQFPLTHHWWSDVQSALAIPAVWRTESDDHTLFYPTADFGYHYLKWLSEALGIPYLVG